MGCNQRGRVVGDELSRDELTVGDVVPFKCISWLWGSGGSTEVERMSSDTEVVFSILTWCWIFYFFNSLKQVPRGGVTEFDGSVSCLAWGRSSLKLKVLALGPNELRPSLYDLQMPSHNQPSALAVII